METLGINIKSRGTLTSVLLVKMLNKLLNCIPLSFEKIKYLQIRHDSAQN